jgi:hypothetical protein
MTAQNFSQALRTRNAYISEGATWATTPATPAMTLFSTRKMGLALTRPEIKDTTIRSDAQPRYALQGNTNVAGDIEMAYYAVGTTSPADDFLASALRGSWVSNQLIVGTTFSSFSIEEGDLDTALFRVFTGVTADKVKLVFGGQDGLIATFSCLGSDMTTATAPVTGATYSAEPLALPMMHFNGTFTEGGTTCAYITGLTIDIDSASTANYALGDRHAKNITRGMLTVTATGTAYYPDQTLLNKFLNGTTSSLSASVGDGTHTRTFALNNGVYTSVTPTTTNAGPVMQNFSFTALFDGTSGSTIVVSRT